MKKGDRMALRVFLTGGSGLIGRGIVDRLLARGDTPIVLSRRSDEVRRDRFWRRVRVVQGDPREAGDWRDALDGCDAVINLAGASVFGRRWDEHYKAEIRESRVGTTAGVVRAIAGAKAKPSVLVQGSATGFYGPHGDEDLTESSPAGHDFLARVCVEWEAAAQAAVPLGVRVATVRTGIVLAKGEGALGVMTPIFKWLPGGAAPVGGGAGDLDLARGQQWMSWIHLDDIVGIFLTALDKPAANGPINGTSPNPVRNVEFSKALAKVLHRPMLPFGPPDAALRLFLGEVADVVAKGQKVLPTRALELGYHFQHPDLLEALRLTFAKVEPPPVEKPAHAAH
jgi:uncharacterized protein (TIGR01777 family)